MPQMPISRLVVKFQPKHDPNLPSFRLVSPTPVANFTLAVKARRCGCPHLQCFASLRARPAAASAGTTT